MASGAPFYKTLLLQIEADLFFPFFFQIQLQIMVRCFLPVFKIFLQAKKYIRCFAIYATQLKEKESVTVPNADMTTMHSREKKKTNHFYKKTVCVCQRESKNKLEQTFTYPLKVLQHLQISQDNLDLSVDDLQDSCYAR